MFCLNQNNNEFEYINHSFKRLKSEMKEYSTRLSYQERVLRDDILAKLLKGRQVNYSEMETLLHSMLIKLDKEYFTVLVLYVENVDNLFFEDCTEKNSNIEEDRKLAHLAIHNILSELLTSENCMSLACEADGATCLILNHDSRDEAHVAWMGQKLREGKKYIETEFNLFFLTGISDSHRGLEGISIGYSEAVSCVEQGLLSESREIISFSEVKTQDAISYYFPTEAEQKIIYNLKTGNYDECSKVLEEIFNTNFRSSEQPKSILLARCLMSDVLSAAIKALTEIQGNFPENALDIQRFMKGLQECETIVSMMNLIRSLFKQECQYIGTIQCNISAGLKEKVDSYLTENYADFSLDVSSVAHYLNLNPSYLSRCFKQQNGTGLSEYVSRYRVQRAQEILLNESNITLEEVGRRVGFCSVRTFSRVFSKYVGIAPGQYKEMIVKNVEVGDEIKNRK